MISSAPFRLVHYTTSESEQTALLKAWKDLEDTYPGRFNVDFRGGSAGSSAPDDLLTAAADADFMLATLMGAMLKLPDADSVFGTLRDLGVPFHVQSSVASYNESLKKFSSLAPSVKDKVHSYVLAGGAKNYRELLKLFSNLFKNTDFVVAPPTQVPWHGIYTPEQIFESMEQFHSAHPGDGIRVGLLFNRSQFTSGNLRVVDAMYRRGAELGLIVVPVFFYTVAATDAGNEALADVLRKLWLVDGKPEVDVICSLAGFSLSIPSTSASQPASGTILEELDVPVLKAIASTSDLAHWKASQQGCSQLDYSFSFVMPEFDGQIIGQLTSTKERTPNGPLLMPENHPAEGLEAMLETCRRYGRLRRISNANKKIAIVLHNYPTGDAYIGSASGLDTFATVLNLLKKLQEQGYNLARLPADNIELYKEIINRGSNERRWISDDQESSFRWLSAEDYSCYFDSLPHAVRTAMVEAWGPAPGEVLTSENGILIPGVENGNVFIAVQPSRGYGDDPDKILHDPAAPPTHQYLAYYYYLREVFGADAFIHMGTHGSLEFLPGKSLGLSQDDFPQLLIQNIPNFYCYIIKNPGEGTIAKRRSFADIVSYLIPGLAFVNSYDEIEDLEGLLEAYESIEHGPAGNLEPYEQQLRDHLREINLDSDLDINDETDIDDVISRVEEYLAQVHASFIKLGMHTLGVPLAGEDLVSTVAVIMRLDNGEIPGLPRALAQARGMDWDSISADSEANELIDESLSLVRQLSVSNWSPSVGAELAGENSLLQQAVSYICTCLVPNLMLVADEMDHLLHGLSGGFIPPGRSGNISRGGADLLPTGRNFCTLDPRTVPTPAAWVTGEKLGIQLLADYAASNNDAFPESIGIVVWGLSTIRSGGDDLAEILWLLGLRPVWQKSTGRISGLEVIDSAELGRPRIDVTVRISGLFRDTFPQAIELLNEAFALVAGLGDEPFPNYVRDHVLNDTQIALAAGEPSTTARNDALLRIFGSAYGSYGTGVSTAIDESAWKDRSELAEIYLAWGSFAFGPGSDGECKRDAFVSRLRTVEATVQNATSRETDILDVDDYYQYHGGLANTVAAVSGNRPVMYCGDSSDPSKVRLRRADKELKFVYRNRILNPIWAQRLQEHGYKAGSDFSKMISNAFGWDATSDVLDDWMYEELAQRYAIDAQMREFLKQNNPQAQFDIIEQLLEAEQRGMWKANPETLAQLRQLYLEIENQLEGE